MISNTPTINEYMDKLPDDRKASVKKLREIALNNLPEGFEERISSNMLGYVVPHSIYPSGYHVSPNKPLPFLDIASQKNFIAIYHMGLYAIPEVLEWFTSEYPKHSKYKLNMGKSCVRFKKIDDIPYDLIKELLTKLTPQDWVKVYEASIKP